MPENTSRRIRQLKPGPLRHKTPYGDAKPQPQPRSGSASCDQRRHQPSNFRYRPITHQLIGQQSAPYNYLLETQHVGGGVLREIAMPAQVALARVSPPLEAVR